MKPAFVLNDVTGEYEASRHLSENDIINQATMIVAGISGLEALEE